MCMHILANLQWILAGVLISILVMFIHRSSWARGFQSKRNAAQMEKLNSFYWPIVDVV